MRNSSTIPPIRWQDRLKGLQVVIRRAIPFVSGIAAALLALWLYNMLAPGPKPLTTGEVKDTINAVLASATVPPAFSTRAYQIIQPSVVLIEVETPGKIHEVEQALGTGVVINDQGDILTSLHVVKGATDIQLTFADGSKSGAQIVAEQPEKDIAVLHALQSPPVLIPAILGNPNAMNVGDEAYVAGNPYGLYSSMSAGVISGFDRSFSAEEGYQEIEGLIQIDAPVNPGNSGSPLINRDGHVIGIVVGLLNPTGDDFNIGIGFAVPIDIAGGAAGSPPY